jgi:hypothetical protein
VRCDRQDVIRSVPRALALKPVIAAAVLGQAQIL